MLSLRQTLFYKLYSTNKTNIAALKELIFQYKKTNSKQMNA